MAWTLGIDVAVRGASSHAGPRRDHGVTGARNFGPGRRLIRPLQTERWEAGKISATQLSVGPQRLSERHTVITLRHILEIPGSKLLAANDTDFVDVVTNSRESHRGSLFAAIRGKRDGHNYIDEAIKNGARGLLVDRNDITVPDGITAVLTNNTIDGLQTLAANMAARSTAKIVAVTGSVGKTTTKDMISHLIGDPNHTVASEKSYNNYLGVPLTLLRIRSSTRYVVAEVGTNHPGEISPLTRIVGPHAAIVTNVGYAHIGNFRDRDDLADEKVSIFSQVRPDGCLIFNGDDQLILDAMARIPRRPKQRLVRVGFNPDNDIACLEVTTSSSQTTAKIMVHGITRDFAIPAVGKHFVYNAMFALAVCSEFDIPLEESLLRLKTFAMPEARSTIVRVSDMLNLIDDSYNGSPDSLLSALESMQSFDSQRKIAILGEMRELGANSSHLHKQVAHKVATTCTHLIAVGDAFAEILASSSIEAGMWPERVAVTKSATAAAEVLRNFISGGLESTTVLVKGSRFSHMERTILALRGDVQVRCTLTTCNLYIQCRACERLENP